MKKERYSNKKQEKSSKNNIDITKSFVVNRSSELLDFLLNKCKTSRNNVKNLLARNQVLVNGSVVSQYNFMLVKDDEVKISKRPVNSGLISKKPLNEKVRTKLPFKIIYQDDDIIAIDKPAGLLSVESDKESECAYAYMLKYFQQKDKNARPYILHRIDKETSGVLIFAKNPKIHSMLKLNWNENVKLREYYAIVEGEMEKSEGTIVSYLKQNSNNLVYSSNDKTGQKAITHYFVEKSSANYSLLRVLIDTGRKNQIRVHMHDLKHPIIGDEKYGYTQNPLNRLGLHASKLEFVNPKTKKLISISAPVPESFKKLSKIV